MSLIEGKHMKELEPEINNVIKKFLGFSETSVLAATVSAILQGGGMELISVKLSGLLDHRKANKLASRIWDVVDDFCISHELTEVPGAKKRNSSSSFLCDYPGDIKKSKDELVMTSTQIKAMMSDTMKEIQQRRKQLEESGIIRRGVVGLSGIGATGPLASPAHRLDHQTPEEKAKTIAALQAQIASKIEKIGEVQCKPQALILNDKGRMVDTEGVEITFTQHVPTLKANLRAKKRDEMKEHIRDVVNQNTEEASAIMKYYDPRLSRKQFLRQKRSFKFHDAGKFQAEGNRIRMKAQLEKLQAGISTIARKTGITSATQLAKLVPKGDGKDRIPDVEWWDQLIVLNDSYDSLRLESITNLIEHPVQLQPLEPHKTPHVAVFLTKKERKKLRRQNRREAWKEKQDKIRLGLLEPDQPKVKMSNLMRVLGTEAVQDPTKVEAHVRDQMTKRLLTHEKNNAERKLNPEQKKDKLCRKLKEDTSGGIYVAVYRIKSLANQSKKFKVETNARQLYLTGSIVIYEDVNVVVVEGGAKQQKKYKQLLLLRIKWNEENYKDKDGIESINSCKLVWEGQAKERSFSDIRIKMCPSESFAREHFKKAGVEHYWDQAYSEAVLEVSDNL